MATLKLRLKARKMAPSNHARLGFRRLRDESVAQEYKPELAESLGECSDSDAPETRWAGFKTEVGWVRVTERASERANQRTKTLLFIR